MTIKSIKVNYCPVNSLLGGSSMIKDNFIYQAAILAHLAYEDKAREEIFKDIGSDHDNFECMGTKGFLLEGENQLSISISGTQSLKDWLFNFIFENKWLPSFISDKNPDTTIHTGFSIKAFSVYSEINSRIIKAVKEGKILHIMGHSSGGSIASFLAHRILDRFPQAVICLYNFGSPKLGNQQIYKELFDNCTSCFFFANVKDVVSYLPWSYPSNPYLIRMDFEGNSWLNLRKSHSVVTYVSIAKAISEDLMSDYCYDALTKIKDN